MTASADRKASKKVSGALAPATRGNRSQTTQWAAQFIENLNTMIWTLGHGSAAVLCWMVLVPVSPRKVLVLLASEETGSSEEKEQWKQLSQQNAEFTFQLQEDATRHTDEKIRQLLTVSAGLATLVLTLARDVGGGIERGAVFVPLTIVAALCLLCLTVRNYWSPDPQPDDERGRAKWRSDVFGCCQANYRLQEVRVEYYRGALRWFFVAMAALCVLGIAYGGRLDRATASTIRSEGSADGRSILARAKTVRIVPRQLSPDPCRGVGG